MGETDQLVPPVNGWQLREYGKWSTDTTLECSSEVEEVIGREEERIKREVEERKAAEVDAAAERGGLAQITQPQQMDISGDPSLSLDIRGCT